MKWKWSSLNSAFILYLFTRIEERVYDGYKREIRDISASDAIECRQFTILFPSLSDISREKSQDGSLESLDSNKPSILDTENFEALRTRN